MSLLNKNNNNITHDLPFVFIIDIDGTMVGNVEFQVQQYSLHNSLKKHGFKPNKQHDIPPAFHPNSKLIRPGFGHFIKSLYKYYNENIYFFIYTASENSWANTEIAWIEKTHGIKFQRPIFTRKDCIVDSSGQYRKTIGRIFPRILRIICKNKKLSNQDKHYILENNLLMIDNNAVYTDRSDKLLLCPDYNYAVFENLLHGIPAASRNHPEIQKLIFSLVNQGLLCSLSDPNDDSMRVLAKQYSWLSAKCKALVDINASFEYDEFWKHLRRLIVENGLRTFNRSVVQQLNTAVWKRHKKEKIKQNGGVM